MNENVKAICSTITIVAILALLGVMVYLHVDGAVVGALGVIGTIIAWLQRTPDRKDPPSGAANAIPLIAAGALLAALLACGAVANEPLPVPTKAQKEVFAGVTYKGQMLECVDRNETAATIDACADLVRARWNRFDGGAR